MLFPPEVRSFLFISFFLVDVFSSFSQQGKRNVTTSSFFIDLVDDSRSSAMGYSGVSTSSDGNSIFHNPAKIVFTNDAKRKIALNYTPWLRNLAKDVFLSNINYQELVNERHGFGVGFKFFSYGNLILRQEDGSPAGKILPYELTADIAYSLKLDRNYSMGLASRYLHSNFSLSGIDFSDAESTNGFSLDISGYYESDEIKFHNFIEGLIRSGFAIRNIGPKVKILSGKGFLPTKLRLGAGFDFIFDDFNELKINLELDKFLFPNNPIYNDDNFFIGIFRSFHDSSQGFIGELNQIGVSLGFEYLWKKIFFFRFGFYKEDEYFYNLSTKPSSVIRKFFNLGLGFHKFESFSIDLSYSMNSSFMNAPLQNTLRFSICLYLGRMY